MRSVQQVVINKQMDKIDIDELTRANMKKYEEKRAKAGLPPQKITNQAHQNVRNVNAVNQTKGAGAGSSSDKAKKLENAYEHSKNAKPGSITAKANLVRDFNERNKKK